jgi:hypothetical protein
MNRRLNIFMITLEANIEVFVFLKRVDPSITWMYMRNFIRKYALL